MNRRARILTVATLAAAVAAQVTPGTSHAATSQPAGGLVTIMFAHTGNLVTANCQPDPQGVTLDTITTAMASRHMSPTGTLVTGWVGTCLAGVPLLPVPKFIAVPDWTGLQALYSANWTFVPHSRTYADVTSLTAAAQQSEICGSKHDLTAHGLIGGKAVFAYPNNLFNTQTQAVVKSCGYLTGRSYNSNVNTLQPLTNARLTLTQSVNGGWCNNSSLPCYNFSGSLVRYHYSSPVTLETRLASVRTGQWTVVQFYRPIIGSGPDGDCTSSDWHDHWTIGTEYYCWNDLQQVLNAIPSTAAVVSPLTAELALGLGAWQ